MADELFPTLDADRIRLRGLHAGDAEDLLAVFGDPEVVRYFGLARMTGRADAVALIDSIHEATAAGTLIQWGIERKRDGRVVGTTTLARIDRRNERAEIGFALGRLFWGQGFATEAVSRTLAFAFDVWKLHRIEADVDPRNLTSLCRLQELGFTREGLLRERWYKDGERQDSVLLGLLAQEWRT